MQRRIVILEVGMTDIDGETYPEPVSWDWEDLVGSCSFISSFNPDETRP